MNDNSRKSDEELERLYNQGNDRVRKAAEDELYNRGFQLDPKYNTWDIESNQHTSSTNDETGLGGLVLLILGIVILIASFIGGFIIIAYAVEYALYIYIGFVITFVLMFLAKGKSAFVNFIFYLGCFALATRLFTNVIEMFEDVDYVTFLTRDSDGLGVIIKYGFLYTIYAFIVPLLMMKAITTIVRRINSKHENKNSTLNV